MELWLETGDRLDYVVIVQGISVLNQILLITIQVSNSCLIIRDQYHALIYNCTLCFLYGCTDTGGHFAGAYVPPSVYESVVCCSRS